MSLPTTSPLSASSDLRHPLPPAMNVRAALGMYLAENAFTTDEYTADTFGIEVFGKMITLTNSANRKKAVPFHDLHHVATGYGTDLVGEAEVGAFELVGGCTTPVTYALNLAAVAGGLFLAPLRTLRALRDARRAKSLYRKPAEYAALLDLTVGELRAHLGLPAEGLAREPRRLHETAPVPATSAA